MFTRNRITGRHNRFRRMAQLEPLENRALMTADSLPFADVAEASDTDKSPPTEIQDSDSSFEIALGQVVTQNSQIDRPTDFVADDLRTAVITRLEKLRSILATKELDGIGELNSLDEYIQSIDDVLGSLKGASDIGSDLNENGDHGSLDPFDVTTGNLNLDGPNFDWSSGFASDGPTEPPKEFPDKPPTEMNSPEEGANLDGADLEGPCSHRVHDDPNYENSDDAYFESDFGEWVTQLVDPESGNFNDALNEWLGVELSRAYQPDESDVTLPDAPNHVYSGPDGALSQPLTTSAQLPVDYEDIAGQPDPYEADPQNGSIENARPVSMESISPNPGPMPGVGPDGPG